jgi:MFS family permease
VSRRELRPEERRGARVAVSGAFVLLGGAEGTWLPRLPGIKERVGLSSGQLGLTLLALTISLFLSSRVAGALCDRFGSARVMRLSYPLLAALLVPLAFVRGTIGLVAIFVGIGISSGLFDVAMNAQAVAVERAYRRPIMSSIHGFWSVGLLAAGAISTVLAATSVSMAIQFPAMAAVLLLSGAALQRRLLDPEAEGLPRAQSARPRRSRLLPSAGVLVLGAIAFAAFLSEGAAASWSAIYLHDSLGAGAGLAAAAFLGFSVGMAVTRLCSDRMVSRIGPVRLVRAGAALAVAGLVLALSVHEPALAVAGFVLLGAGFAPVVPVAFSASAGLGENVGAALGWVLTIGYVGSMVGPAAIGLTAQLIDLRAALLIPVALAGLVVVLAPAVATAPSGRR